MLVPADQSFLSCLCCVVGGHGRWKTASVAQAVGIQCPERLAFDLRRDEYHVTAVRTLVEASLVRAVLPRLVESIIVDDDGKATAGFADISRGLLLAVDAGTGPWYQAIVRYLPADFNIPASAIATHAHVGTVSGSRCF